MTGNANVYWQLLRLAGYGSDLTLGNVYGVEGAAAQEVFGTGHSIQIRSFPVPDVVEGRTVTGTLRFWVVDLGDELLLRNILSWRTSRGEPFQVAAEYRLTQDDVARLAAATPGVVSDSELTVSRWNTPWDTREQQQYHARVVRTLADAEQARTCLLRDGAEALAGVHLRELVLIEDWVHGVLVTS